MRNRFSGSMMMFAVFAAAGSGAVSVPTPAPAQAPAGTDAAPKTPWGEPDLQGIWTDETTTPLQRPARYAEKATFYRGRAR